VLSSDLKWSVHIKQCVSKAFSKLGLLFRLRSYLTRQQMVSVYLNIIRPALEYCCVIYDNCSRADSELLDSVQRKAALLCTGAIRRTPTVNLMNELGWDLLTLRRRVFKMILFCNVINNESPIYLVSNIKYNSSVARTRAAGRTKRLAEVRCRTEKYLNSYFRSSIREWNNFSTDEMFGLPAALVKRKLFELWRTQQVPTLVSAEYINEAGGGLGRFLTQTRMRLSPLNYHLYQFKIIDNPFCPNCGTSLETPFHFFMECTKYTTERSLLMQEMIAIFSKPEIKNNKAIFSPEEIFAFIINEVTFAMSETQRKTVNKSLFSSVKKFIISTKRLNSDYYYYD